MVLIEMVYCKITGKTRDLPKVHHFVPVVPWSNKKVKGKKFSRFDGLNNSGGGDDGDGGGGGGGDGHPATSTVKHTEQVKLVLDMSNDGPVFKILESLMARCGGSGEDRSTYEALDRLLRSGSGVPGLEALLRGGGGLPAGPFLLSDEDKRAFLEAVTGVCGKINGKAAVALIAAAASGGDPEVANMIIEKMMMRGGGSSVLADNDVVDPATIAAMMATTELAARGASNQEIMEAIQRELAKSAKSPEDILTKTVLLQKALLGDSSPNFVNKTVADASHALGLAPLDMAKALFVQKAMVSLGSGKDLAFLTALLALLEDRGVPDQTLLEALLALAGEPGSLEGGSLWSRLRLKDGMSIEEMVRMLETCKSMVSGGGGGARGRSRKPASAAQDGLEALVRKILGAPGGEVTSGQVAQIFSEAAKDGLIGGSESSAARDLLTLARLMVASGVSAETLAATMRLQLDLHDGGVTPSHEVSQAMSLLAALASKAGSGDLDEDLLKAALMEDTTVALTGEAIRMLASLPRECMAKKAPDEGVRLLKKAIRQRRGSVDNVTETLVAALAGDGENKEGLSKVMVNALRATGATPAEIALTMNNAMKKAGLEPEEIMKILIRSLTEAGSSPAEAMDALKSVFLEAIQNDPETAPDFIRSLAETMATSGATCEEMASVLSKGLEAILAAQPQGQNVEDLLDISDTMARILAEVGASPSAIADTVKAAFKACKDNCPFVFEELAKVLAKSMMMCDASGEDMVKALRQALEASGASQGEMAEVLLVAIASNATDINQISHTMQEVLNSTGLDAKTVRERVLVAMLESGADPDTIAQTMALQGILGAAGDAADEIAKKLLEHLRSGEAPSADLVLGSLGMSGEEVYKALLAQSALHRMVRGDDHLLEGLASVLVDMAKAHDVLAAKSRLDDTLERFDCSADQVLELVLVVGLDPEDHEGGQEGLLVLQVEASFETMKKLGPLIIDGLQKNAGGGAEPTKEAVMATAGFTSLWAALGMSPVSLVKLVRVQEAMYRMGASVQDIADTLVSSLDGLSAPHLQQVPHGLIQAFKVKGLQLELPGEVEVKAALDLVEAFSSRSIPTLSSKQLQDLVRLNLILGQDMLAMETALNGLASSVMAGIDPASRAKVLGQKMAQLLDLTEEDLADVLLVQKALLGTGVVPEDVRALYDLRAALMAEGFRVDEILGATVVGAGTSEIASLTSQVLDHLTKNRDVSGPDVRDSGQILAWVKMGQDLGNKAGAASNGAEPHPDRIQAALDALVVDWDVGRKGRISRAALAERLLAFLGKSKARCLVDVLELQRSLLRAGPAQEVADTLNGVLTSQLVDDQALARLRAFLGEALDPGNRLLLSTEFWKKTQERQVARTTAAVEKALGTLKGAGSSDADDKVAKSLLVQKILSGAGIDPGALVRSLKSLGAGSTISPEDRISAYLKDPRFSQDQVEALIRKTLQNGLTLNGSEVQMMGDLANLLKHPGVWSDPRGGDPDMLLEALFMQQILGITGLTPDDFGKMVALQETLLAQGVAPEALASILTAGASQSSSSSASDSLARLAAGMLQRAASQDEGFLVTTAANLGAFEAVVSNSGLTRLLASKLQNDDPAVAALVLLEAGGRDQGLPVDDLLEAVGRLIESGGECNKVMDMLRASQVMAQAGATREEVQELMALMGCAADSTEVSEDFLAAVVEILRGPKGSGGPKAKLDRLREVMAQELSSVGNFLRQALADNQRDAASVDGLCKKLAEQMAASKTSREDVRTALVDLLDDAIDSVTRSEPDSNLILSNLILSSMAAAISDLEQENLPSSERVKEVMLRETVELLEKILAEADLASHAARLAAYGASFEGLGEFMVGLMADPAAVGFFNRHVAFLYEFEKVEHSTVIGISLQDILKEAKHKLRPWELGPKGKGSRGYKFARVPNLSYSQVFCFYKVLPDHLVGPTIGLSYE